MPIVKETIVAIAAGAGYTDVPATMAARHVKVEETNDQAGGAYAPGLLDYKSMEDNFVSVTETATPGETLELGNPIAEGNAFGCLVGSPVQNNANAWSGATTYALGDRVVNAGKAYVSLQAANLNNAPGYNAFWTPDTTYLPATVYFKIRRQDAASTKVKLTEIS